jgi:hypothetical protein
MFENLLIATLGECGPLIIETKNGFFIENCMIISRKNIDNVIRKLHEGKYSKIEQTTDRSFFVA